MHGSFHKYFGRIKGNMVLFAIPNLRFAFVIHIRTASSRSSPGKPLTAKTLRSVKSAE
jgi:hypothetical protein